MLNNYESARGNYRVRVTEGKPIIEVSEDGTVYYIDQLVKLDTVEDLVDLFVVIGSVLNMIYGGDYDKR